MCTGNICRSPMAEYLARELTDGDEIKFSSAGVGTIGGAHASLGTTEVMAELGIDVSEHRSRTAWELVDTADVIYVLSIEHRAALTDRRPDLTGSIHLLRPDGGSIDDPYGMAIEDYRLTREEIEAAVRNRIATGWGP